MALLVSISFPAPHCAARTSVGKMYCEKTALGGISNKATTGKGTNYLVLCNLNRGLFSVNLSCHHPLTSSSRHFDGIVSCCLDVSSCTHKIITGYWVGPDIDDGWGFVEAFVNRVN